ncbi:succinate dehydrogenase cytochrome b subunit [Filimonas effusa]|uniref:Succinate dehydrogenase cytochrome b subunit n=1 Tax=Filimonas effusa TaxID=2508721 RepID=A0A4Q1DCN3_9BACT|nr:succinate dehydrogenase cytochrome b subunit [Filimonas effusa]RXK87284.1 succinate dehydrogenase cytochrome b subunit [Filimonas effusa]
MTWKQVFTSSIGQKLTMGLSGIFLILFLVVHAGLNACIWAGDGGEMFNKAAHFMGATIVPRVLEVGLFVFLLLHIIQGLVLEFNNRSKRSQGYAVSYGNRGSKWYSRSMGLLGTIILMFLVVHLIHFWIPSRFTGLAEANYGGVEMHDLYSLMKATFEELWVVILYVLGCISLAYHLAHGFQSAFRTLGVHNKRYVTLLKTLGYGFSVIVPLAFALMPVTMYLDLV